MVERLHRHLKSAIRCHEAEQWADMLPAILLGFCAAWKEDLQATSADLVYGAPLRLHAPYDGPFRVLQRNGKTFKVQLPSRDSNISIDRLKPAHVTTDLPLAHNPSTLLVRPPSPSSPATKPPATEPPATEPPAVYIEVPPSTLPGETDDFPTPVMPNDE
ncbi:uncharacterized protein LOC124155220 [Ischnura elegans]|uniref:uncharacterized protein LOC124155220 n=1 Tax=Ischnura elegans TaxID=197161 RepID=UPI001ED8A92F|nr:uncharacterized protein LOC124155220 [Ischnura elegans]